MKQIRLHTLALLLLFLITACLPASAEETTPPMPVTEPTTPPLDMGMPVQPTDDNPVPAVTEMVAIEITTHTDETGGYSFDYPSAWMLDSVVFGSRAPGGYQLTSWAHEPGMVNEVPANETIMNILIQLWDPKADLAAFVEQRKTAWEASGIEIVSEESLTLANGQPAIEFITQSQGQSGYFLFSTLGENYLAASGSGDIELMRQVARSLR